jgi:hypothetical protein
MPSMPRMPSISRFPIEAAIRSVSPATAYRIAPVVAAPRVRRTYEY